ncbi:MAG: TRAP transporter small permease, partial [Paracoccus sp. (in: a-proteobacteria)]|nr:TRAP transporter small permease [Paracoccus sp. (in: a-proteobacteria)]
MRDLALNLANFTGLIAKAALWLAGLGLVLMTIFVFAQVFARYLLGYSLYWAEPGSVMLMGWFI